jgi:hypothetical protein
MDNRWKTPKAWLFIFISLGGLLILLMGLTEAHPAAAQNALPQFNLVGNAIMHEDRLGLTVNQQLHTGAAWLPDKQQVQDGFTAEFQWQINRVNQRRGAEGFAFVIHNADGQPFPDILLGEGRHGLGYQGIPNSIAVEFDTVQTSIEDFGSGKGDPNDNHISVQTRGRNRIMPTLIILLASPHRGNQQFHSLPMAVGILQKSHIRRVLSAFSWMTSPNQS